MPVEVGLLVFPNVQQLDLTGPYEVFASWPEARVRLVWKDRAPIVSSTGLRLEPGKLVEELRPPIDVDKGSAISALLAAHGDLTAFAYAGDDLGDIPALRKARDAGGYALVIDHGKETDPRLLELADETFAGTEAFADWLGKLENAAAY